MNERAISLATEMVARLESGATKQAFQSIADLSIDFCESIPTEIKRGSIPFLIYKSCRTKVAEAHAEHWAEILRTNPTRAYIADQVKFLQPDIADRWQYSFSDPFQFGQMSIGVLWFNEIIGRKNVTMTDELGVQSVVEQRQISERMWDLTEKQTEAIATLNQWIRFLRAKQQTKAKTATAADPPPESEANGNVDDLPKSQKLAFLATAYAEAKVGRRLTDPESWAYLKQYGIQGADELDDYDLPMQDTFADYMNLARRALKEKKYSPRGGRRITKASDL